jgi:hypothetical protein
MPLELPASRDCADPGIRWAAVVRHRSRKVRRRWRRRTLAAVPSWEGGGLHSPCLRSSDRVTARTGAGASYDGPHPLRRGRGGELLQRDFEVGRAWNPLSQIFPDPDRRRPEVDRAARAARSPTPWRSTWAPRPCDYHRVRGSSADSATRFAYALRHVASAGSRPRLCYFPAAVTHRVRGFFTR